MADIEQQFTISRPITEVYKAATDYEDSETLQKWQTDLRNIGITAGDPLRTGSMIGMTKHFMNSDIFVNFDVVDFQRNKRFELKGVHGRFPYRREIEFSPNARETIINDKIIISTGWLFFWYRPIVISALKKQTAQEWQNLKQLLENN